MCVRKWIVVTTSSRCWTLWRTSVPLVQYLTCFCRQIGSDCIQLHTLVSLNLDCQVNCCSNNLVSVVLKLWLIHWSIRGRGTSTNVYIFYGWFGGPPPIRQAEAHAGFDSAQVFAAEVDGSEWPGGELGLFLLPFVTLCYPQRYQRCACEARSGLDIFEENQDANLVNIMGRSQTDGHKQQHPARRTTLVSLPIIQNY
jgi:hypothetical protein